MIREYLPKSDKKQLIALLAGFQKHLHGVDTHNEIREFASTEDTGKYLEKMVDDSSKMNGKILVATDSGKIVGFIQGVVNPRDDIEDIMYTTTHNPSPEGWIGLLYVMPEMRGRQIGITLIDAMKEYFTGIGCTSLRLLVSKDNANTVNIYRKYGFTERDIEMSLPLKG